MPIKWGGGGEEDRNWDDCIKRDVERVREEWRTTATHRRNWRLLKKDNGNGNHGQRTHDSDAKKKNAI